MSEQTLLHNRAGDAVRAELRIRELEKTVRDVHTMLVRLQVNYQAAANKGAKVNAAYARGHLNHAVWLLSKQVKKSGAQTP